MRKFVLIFFSIIFAYNVINAKIVNFELSNSNSYKIYTSLNNLTTIMFPIEIDKILGSNIIPENLVEKFADKAEYSISFVPNSNFFTIKQLKKEAIGVLHIIIGQKTYVIHFEENNSKAMSSVTLINSRHKRQSRPMVTPIILKSLFDQAKTWDNLQDKYPGVADDVDLNEKSHISKYDNYEVEVLRVWRFNKYDTLIFMLALRNASNHILKYNPRLIAFATGDNRLFASMVEASGILAPQQAEIIFASCTGNSEGGRNNLMANNDWFVLLQANFEEVKNNEQLAKN